MEMQWKNTTDDFEDASEITQQTPPKNQDKSPFNKEKENGANIILDLTKTAFTIEKSPDAEICKKNSRSYFDV